MIANKTLVKAIHKDLRKKFGTVTKAKQKAKKLYSEVEEKWKAWNKLGSRKRLWTSPPSTVHTLIKINKTDFLYYSPSKGCLTAPHGKGFYVRIKTRCGAMDYKF